MAISVNCYRARYTDPTTKILRPHLFFVKDDASVWLCQEQIFTKLDE
nr:MAG TPA: hypothetical protein [Caudoviricetes sp.]